VVDIEQKNDEVSEEEGEGEMKHGWQSFYYQGNTHLIHTSSKHQQKKTCLQLPYNALLCLTEPVRHNKAL